MDNRGSVDFQLCGDMDVVLTEHSSMQLSQCLAGLADPGVNVFVQKHIAQEDASQAFEAFTFVSWVLSTVIFGSMGLIFGRGCVNAANEFG